MSKVSRKRRIRTALKHGVLLFMLSTTTTLQGCAILGTLSSIFSAVAPILSSVTSIVGSVQGLASMGGNNAQAAQIPNPAASQQIAQNPAVPPASATGQQRVNPADATVGLAGSNTVVGAAAPVDSN